MSKKHFGGENTKTIKKREWCAFLLGLMPIPVCIVTIVIVAVAVSLAATLGNSSSPPMFRNATFNLTNFVQDCERVASFGTRLPNSIGANQTRQFITEKLLASNFTVEYDSFSQDTVIGKQTFHNIVGRFTVNPNFKTVIIAAHYDSKLFNDFYFIGASDSLVPCVMMLHMAANIGNWKNLTKNVEFIFFDGEEAFQYWSATDSLYGSRHLAAKYQDAGKLSNIQSFILLDLIGASNPTFRNFQIHYQGGTSGLLSRLVTIQRKYNVNYFVDGMAWESIEDDHIPWLQRGVSVLHLISAPFPSVWHTEADNLSNMSYPTCEIFMNIMLEFLQGYL